VPDSVLVLVREEFRVGRFWHGVGRFREALGGEVPATLEDRLLLAEGEAGWGNWPAVIELLGPPLEKGEGAPFNAWFLLGRAREEMGDPEGAQEAYTRCLGEVAEGAGAGAGSGEADFPEILLRRSRARWKTGDPNGALEDLREVVREEPTRGRWLGLELARAAADAGSPQTTLTFLAEVPPEEVRLKGWELPARALLVSGDSAGAEAAYWSSLPSLASASERGRAWERVGALRLARSDSLGARAAFHQVLREDPRGGLAVDAASALLTLGFDSASVARLGAEALARGGRDADALRAYEAYGNLNGGALPRDVTLALARIHLSLREPRVALILLDSLAAEEGPAVSAPVLVLQAQALGALGRTAAARAVQDSLISAFPHRPEAVEILFLRADALQGQGDLSGAIRGFEATAALSPSQNLAGQARMRLGQIYLSQGRSEEAARVYQEYLDTFPDGRRWDEAAFWAGRALLSVGREEEGTALLEELRGRFALSYYTVQSGVLLEEPYDPGLPEAVSTPSPTGGMTEALARIDALRRVGLAEGAGWEIENLSASIREVEDVGTRRALLLRLALELNERGLTREGINLGWEIRRLGGDWDRDLLSAIYPFPYREMVFLEAEEHGLDPFLMAGLMRQESAFWHEARSRADARGLMQVLPGTGVELARARGPRGFDADEHLYRPEINLHLGMSFFADLQRRFGEDLSILLSAYNAGPTRARRWREYPEAGDLVRFVERIPFTETRGYVKNVLLNREIYAWLYGAAGGEG
jgi:soluble lytic murein transglycosylase